jgi:hypothetical protein
MRMHPEFSWAVLRLVPGLERASLYALHHHEKYNGSGYPAGLKGEEIPIGSRIVSGSTPSTQWSRTAPTRKGCPSRRLCDASSPTAESHFDLAEVST